MNCFISLSIFQNFDKELRRRESESKERFEQQLLDMQHSYEATLVKKENDLTSLLQSMKQAESQAEGVKEFETKIGDFNFDIITSSLSRREAAVFVIINISSCIVNCIS